MPSLPPLSASVDIDTLGRRGSPRIHLSLPGKLVSVVDTQPCMLLDLSQTGARIAVGRTLPVNAGGYLKLGPVEVFGIVVRVRVSEEGGGINAVAFDSRLAKAQMLALRAYAEHYELSEQREAFRHARAWVMGGG